LKQARIDARSAKIEFSGETSLRLDAEGRWGSYRRGPDFFRRTLRDEVWCREREVDAAERNRIDGEILACLQTTRRLVLAQDIQILGSPRLLLELLDRALALEESVSQRQALFDKAYAERVPILPPDRYRDLVVLPATGCPNGQCSFCAFYRGVDFRAFSLEEFTEHLDDLERLLGRALAGRDGLFLGSANALALPAKKLVPMLEHLHERFESRPRGLASFYDPEHAPGRNLADWQQLEELGLTQVVLGLETADPDLRQSLGKSPDLSLIDENLDLLGQTGIRVGLTLLLGAGPAASADAQLATVCDYLSRLPLDAEDLVYLSPLDDSTWPLAQTCFAPWRKALRASTPAQLVHYSMDRFHYYA